MRTDKLEGIGSIHGGEYGNVEIEGIGTIKGDIKAQRIYIDGIGKCIGAIDTEEFICDGVAHLSNSMRAKKVKIDGVVKQAKNKIEANDIYCDGVLMTTGEISADNIEIYGYISASEVYGDTVKIMLKPNRNHGLKLPTFLSNLGGKKIRYDRCIIDIIEATTIEISGVEVDSVSGNTVIIGPGCVIQQVECNGILKIHPSSKVNKIDGVTPTPWQDE